MSAFDFRASLRFPRAWLEPPPTGVYDLGGNQPLERINKMSKGLILRYFILIFFEVDESTRCETPAGEVCQGRPRRCQCTEEAPETTRGKRVPRAFINN